MSICRAVLLGIAASVFLQPVSGQPFDYVSTYSGWVFLNDYEGESLGTPRIGTFSDGWLLGGALGKNLCNCYRFETEFFYRNNRSDQWTGPLGTVDWDGRFNNFSSMANLLKDFQALKWHHSTPYAGGGIGAAYLDGEFTTPVSSYEIDETVFAFQGIAGVRTQLTCRLSLLTEYRYFGTSNARLVELSSGGVGGTFGYDSHNAMIGLSLSR